MKRVVKSEERLAYEMSSGVSTSELRQIDLTP